MWEFYVHHIDGSKEWVSPAISLHPQGFLLCIYNGIHTYEYDVRELREWKLEKRC